MAAVQGGLVEAADKKDIKVEPSEESGGNNTNNASDGRLLSPAPAPAAPAAASNNAAAGAPVDQQTLLAVLQFLRKNNLSESVEILRREAGLPEDSPDAKGGDSAAGSAGSGSADTEGGDASSLLSRVTISSTVVAPAPTKGSSSAVVQLLEAELLVGTVLYWLLQLLTAVFLD